MRFETVPMMSQGADGFVRSRDVMDVLGGKQCGNPALPILVFPFDLPLGLRRGRVSERHTVEFQRPSQLGQGVRILGEEEAVIVDVESQRKAMLPKSCRQKVHVGQQVFPLVDLRFHEQAAAIVEHVEHGIQGGIAREPGVGRGVQLPEFSDLLALPAANRRPNLLSGYMPLFPA